MTENENLSPDLNIDPKIQEHRIAADKRPRRSHTMKIIIVGAVIAVGILAMGYVPRSIHAKEAEETAQRRKSAVPDVSTYIVRPGNARALLALPGNIEPITEAVKVVSHIELPPQPQAEY